jgi:hypothetical protein
MGDKVDSGKGLQYRPISLCSPVGRYDNPMPESILFPESGTMNLATSLEYSRRRLIHILVTSHFKQLVFTSTRIKVSFDPFESPNLTLLWAPDIKFIASLIPEHNYVPPSGDGIFKNFRSPGINSKESFPSPAYKDCAGILEQSMVTRNRVGVGLSYRPARLHRLAESIPWNRFVGPKNF